MFQKFKILLLSATCILCSFFSQAQNETNFWFFGDQAGLDFSSGSPVPINTGQTTTREGTAVASHQTTGALLFYSDGLSVWDASHTIMPNGNGLMGGYSSTMAALIVPQPGSSNLFYLFTTDHYQNSGNNGFRFNIIDMSANGGMGDVISKNNLLFSPCAEINHAVKHANCMDYWIISQDAIGNNYNVYLLTSSGLVTSPVISSTGFPFLEPGWGTGKFSPDGNKFARAHGDYGGDDILQLFDFDILTGKLSNPFTLSTAETWYGISFSPDNTKLYASGATYFASYIFQWDVSSGNNSSIISSQINLGYHSSFGQFQIGKDYRIYLSHSSYLSLGLISNPNASGTACSFTSSSIPLTDLSEIGLPIFPENYFNQSPVGTTIFEEYDTTITWGTSAMLFSNGTGNITWSPSTYLSCSYCPNPIVSPEGDIEYIYSDDNNGYGCPILKRIRIKVEYDPQIPNIFTANNDGTNDFFFINRLPPNSKLQIFNRWGNSVYQSNDYQNNWTTEVDGVYYYVLLVHEQEYKGFVQVLTN